MKKLNLTGSVFAGAFVGAIVLAACGGDDSSGLPRGADASTDATIGDTGTTDGAIAPADAGRDADAAPPVCASGQTLCGDTCVDLTSNGDSCGACGNDCAPGTVCNAGACAVACNGGATQCGNSCVNLALDPSNCGACGATCTTGRVCSNFKCGDTCAAGLTLCTQVGSHAGVTADGGAADAGGLAVCVDDSADPNNCGRCGLVCPAGQLCSNGSCATSCQVGLVECNGRCVDPTSNGDYCGATAGCGADAGSAGTVCPSGHVCTTGPLGVGTCATTCAAGQVNCGGTCIDPTSDRDNCGATGDCVTTANDTANSAGVTCGTGQVCTKGSQGTGVCAVSCLAGQVECGGTCIDPLIDPRYCGAVGSCKADGNTTGGVADGPGSSCPDGQLCSKGACVPNCPVGQIDCGGRCVDPQTDNAYCGASGACTGTSDGTDCTKISGTICSASSCQLTCESGQVDCNGICIDPTSDSTHCGVNALCGGGAASSVAGVCPSGTLCTAGTGGLGSCATACAASQVNCGGTCVDPTSDENHCGATSGCGTSGGSTGTVCPAGESCQNGSCSASCGANLTGCGSACVDESNDPSHCGDCNTVCNGANATNVCRSQVCAIHSCNAGYADCNGTVADGCESNRATDAANCGACGNVCAAGKVCTAGACATPVQSYDVNAGPAWASGPPLYTCQQACALLFGGTAGSYSCSTSSTSVTHTAWASTYGSGQHCNAPTGPGNSPVAENFSSGGATYGNGGISAYVSDHCFGGTSINYCFPN